MPPPFRPGVLTPPPVPAEPCTCLDEQEEAAQSHRPGCPQHRRFTRYSIVTALQLQDGVIHALAGFAIGALIHIR